LTEVTAVTIALNNEELVSKLITRRQHLLNLRLALPKGVDLENEDQARAAVSRLIAERNAEPDGFLTKCFSATILPVFNYFDWLLPVDKTVNRVFELTKQIQELQTKEYEAVAVFVTFETEAGQRAALTALGAGKLDVMMNNSNGGPGILFQDKLLSVSLPTEPSSVRWLDLSATDFKKILIRLANLTVTMLLIAFSGWLVSLARKKVGSWLAGPLVAISNAIIPFFVKILMLYEPHSSEGSYQASLYQKITLFRWINTAILTKWITPFTSTVAPYKNDVLAQINSIMWSELWLTPGLRLLDLWGNVNKHLFAPRARNQELMNLSFQGTFYNLGERYTDLTKILFVCFFYSALFPAVFFFGFAILLVQYYVSPALKLHEKRVAL
jgi:hypothetical protein